MYEPRVVASVTILLLSEILDHRKRKAQELKFYTEQKKILEARLAIIRCEINLTDRILNLIRKEQLVEIAPK
jgi:hypothetical protein